MGFEKVGVNGGVDSFDVSFELCLMYLSVCREGCGSEVLVTGRGKRYDQGVWCER